MARAVLRPPRMTDGRAAWLLNRLSPGDLDLPFAPLSFRTRDERTGEIVNLAAWWIPAQDAAGRCAILLHGYSDAKVGAIAWAPLLHALGFNILALDLPAHGQSDYRPVSFGYWERHLVSQVIDQLRAERADETRVLVLYGLSYGGFVAAATAELRDDISALVLDSPPISPANAAMAHCDLLGFPGRPFSTLALRLAAKLAHADDEQMRLSALLARVRSPLLLIESGNDPFNSPDDLRDVHAALEHRRSSGLLTEHLVFTDSPHLIAMQTHPQEYAQSVGRFLFSCRLPVHHS